MNVVDKDEREEEGNTKMEKIYSVPNKELISISPSNEGKGWSHGILYLCFKFSSLLSDHEPCAAHSLEHGK